MPAAPRLRAGPAPGAKPCPGMVRSWPGGRQLPGHCWALGLWPWVEEALRVPALPGGEPLDRPPPEGTEPGSAGRGATGRRSPPGTNPSRLGAPCGTGDQVTQDEAELVPVLPPRSAQGRRGSLGPSAAPGLRHPALCPWPLGNSPPHPNQSTTPTSSPLAPPSPFASYVLTACPHAVAASDYHTEAWVPGGREWASLLCRSPALQVWPTASQVLGLRPGF